MNALYPKGGRDSTQYSRLLGGEYVGETPRFLANRQGSDTWEHSIKARADHEQAICNRLDTCIHHSYAALSSLSSRGAAMLQSSCLTVERAILTNVAKRISNRMLWASQFHAPTQLCSKMLCSGDEKSDVQRWFFGKRPSC